MKELNADGPFGMSPSAKVAGSMAALFTAPEPASPTASASAAAHHRHILFFDGGSRGNPGPGGAGACLVRYDTSSTTASVVWSAAMSLSRVSTTNNHAEYTGLVTGLREAHARKLTRLHVVGDSKLVVNQLRLYRPPRNPRLLALYRQARRLADQLDIKDWFHHLRAHNKMADTLANHAMDTSASSQYKYDQVLAKLRESAATKSLQPSGYECGGTPDTVFPNNQYGSGRLDAAKAMSLAATDDKANPCALLPPRDCIRDTKCLWDRTKGVKGQCQLRPSDDDSDRPIWS
ncbi:hypothetical protein ATCC90586_000719 [Pythium insidiosum]|nr:hypothetical protein ATCC90586_000719 [Pythium insidiosum]